MGGRRADSSRVLTKRRLETLGRDLGVERQSSATKDEQLARFERTDLERLLLRDQT